MFLDNLLAPREPVASAHEEIIADHLHAAVLPEHPPLASPASTAMIASMRQACQTPLGRLHFKTRIY